MFEGFILSHWSLFFSLHVYIRLKTKLWSFTGVEEKCWNCFWDYTKPVDCLNRRGNVTVLGILAMNTVHSFIYSDHLWFLSKMFWSPLCRGFPHLSLNLFLDISYFIVFILFKSCFKHVIFFIFFDNILFSNSCFAYKNNRFLLDIILISAILLKLLTNDNFYILKYVLWK